MGKFMEIFSKLQINIPLLDALRDMPGYAKFLKDAVSNKRKLGKYETINLSEECSAVLQKKLSLKQKDPGSFTIACVIGGQNFSRALCDLGASINLMPLSIFKRLEIREIRPTSIALQMVEQFIFPADFVVLDMPEDTNTPLILGHPFLATGRALIDVQDGDLTFRVNDKKLTLSIYDAMRKPAEPQLHECNMIESVIDFPAAVDDPLEECITRSLYLYSELDEACDQILEYIAELEAVESHPIEPILFLDINKPVDGGSKSGCENVVADHLSRLEKPVEGDDPKIAINELFPDLT
ncbi:uncharacterized protein LOC131023092 [Salvia miltiorrhiza]|uniref:uncharacterized protein LOC131023092 n=1 Tax=Salvia miltiorrhiza TaxID=226208 RepID=UPI0025AD8590|nr:uncharacterized protein LOC131023092 [Salvia miltiorrhiza]